VKFLVDAQLPRSLAGLLQSFGHDAIHTLDLPDANRTSDEALCRVATDEQRVLVTKDGDFVDSFLLRGLPSKLLFVTTGNISNNELLALFRGNLQSIVAFLTALSCFVEIDRSGLTIRD
jgi:predicted nuclease of predicted toxin-antitoxin system